MIINKELKKLRRYELLEILLQLQSENEKLKSEINHLHQELNERKIITEIFENTAESKLKLNKVFEAIQKEINDYLKNILLENQNE